MSSEPPEEFLGVITAGKRYRLGRRTLAERIRRGDIRVFSDPRDDRRKLVSTRDLDKLATPRPMPRQRESAEVR